MNVQLRGALLASLLLAACGGGADDLPDARSAPGADASVALVETILDSGPSAASNEPLVRFEFRASEPATFACTVDGEPAFACTSPLDLASSEAAHLFTVVATAVDGRVDATPAEHAWRSDRTAPLPVLEGFPPPVDNQMVVAFALAANESGSTFVCTLDGVEVACDAAWEVTVGAGDHTVTIVAVDAAGNESDPIEFTWTVDLSVPDTMIDAAPSGTVGPTAVNVAFSSDAGAGATYACAVDGGAASGCTSPLVVSGLASGAHTVAVTVTNLAGTSDPTPAQASFTVDATGPSLAITDGPSDPSDEPVPGFTFTTGDAEAASVECQLDGEVTWTGCTSPWTAPAALFDGGYTFRVRGSDAFGNPGATSYAWVVALPACGNGELDAGEACDDHDLDDDDGCDSNCTATACGNGIATSGEACDDGDPDEGDGCDSNCTLSACGNGVAGGFEACDDGDLDEGDGCDTNCTVSACGNGILASGESCDDGDLDSGDGCDSNCTDTACGNGVATSGEACDDGDLDEGDGCDTNCTLSACGNGVIGGTEACDDGDLDSGDGCDSNCTATACGNGVVTAGEVCDDGGALPDTCSANCQTVIDIDECVLMVDSCASNQHCENTIGSFECRDLVAFSPRLFNNCALFEGGNYKCWGPALFGPGQGVYRPEADAAKIDPVRGVLEVDSGVDHTCALLDDGAIKCWGQGSFGALGNGSNNYVYQPPAATVDLGAGRSAVQVATGGYHSCALLDDASVKCWGWNIQGQLGYGDNTDRMTPPATGVDLGPGRTATAIAVGSYSTCALLDDGGIKCWGYGGALGTGDALDRNAPPAATVDLGGEVATAVITGGSVTCAILTGGRLRCWGQGGWLGYGDVVTRLAPPSTDVDFGPGVTVLSGTAGDGHTCAELSTGDWTCWGRNVEGEVGIGYASPAVLSPGAPLAAAGALAVAVYANGAHTCAAFEDGEGRCWGWNEGGESGLGVPARLSTPTVAVELGGSPGFAAIDLGPFHACGVSTDQQLWCWGENLYGELGYGDDHWRAVPAATPIALGGPAVAVATGHQHTCAVLGSGAVSCWGANFSGQLGTGDTTSRSTPSAPIALGAAATAVVAASGASCAITTLGLQCWGLGYYGRLGYGTEGGRLAPDGTPVDLGAGRTATQVALADQHTCAVLDDGSVKCWGDNAYGQLGYGDTTRRTAPAATAIDLALPAVQVVVSRYSSCAVLVDGSVTCWGYNGNGELGYGDTTQRLEPPAATLDFAGHAVTRLTSGYTQTCALLDDGTITCWGLGNWSLGYGEPFSTRLAPGAPIDLGPGATATDLTGHADGVCAEVNDNEWRCWGYNRNGQLGNGYGVCWGPGAPIDLSGRFF